MKENVYTIVQDFEERMARFAGSKHAVAVASCTNALFLCMKLYPIGRVWLPKRTYVSVPMQVIHAGGSIEWRDWEWEGTYEIKPLGITDGALRMRRDMYEGGLHCLSFHIQKSLPIGRGGMVLTDNEQKADRLRHMRYSGRTPYMPLSQDKITMLGWDMNMTPEQAARGLMLMDIMGDGYPDQHNEYADLSNKEQFPVFNVH